MALKLEGIRLRQGAFTLGAEFDVARGARVAVVGPSGAGKSTLLALLGGFLTPEAGRLLWQGDEITAASPAARPMACLFQDGNLFPHLPMSKNVGLGIDPSLKLDKEQMRRAELALERVGLSGMGSRKPAQLSGGQQSRAALARLLVQDKPVMLLDEPFAALGPAMRAEMLALVGEIADEQDATVFMVSHEPKDALRFASDTILVADGVVQPPKPTAALFEDPPEVLRAYLG